MTEKTKSLWSWLNPLTWISGFFSLLGAMFGSILQAFGLMPHPSTEGFENLAPADVADAEKLAKETEAAVDALQKDMPPAEVVRAYAKADAAGRAAMDLSALGFDGQCWLLGLSDTDLARLSMSTVSGCARSLEKKEVLPIYAKPPPETKEVEILAIPTSEDE